jgi:hypothetical protein
MRKFALLGALLTFVFSCGSFRLRGLAYPCGAQKFHPAIFNPMQHCYIPIAGLERLSCISRVSLI